MQRHAIAIESRPEINGTASGIGELSSSQSLSASLDLGSVASAWSAAGSDSTCVVVVPETRVTEGAPTAWSYLGLVKTGPGSLAFLAESQPSDQLRLTIVINGLNSDDTVQLRLDKRPLRHARRQLVVVYSDTFPAALKTGTISVPSSELRNVMALRIRNTGTGFTQCAPAVIMANTEGG